ncbi:MAG: prenyltransferase [Candidatus Limnocylindrales bacterium]|jgi:1,4-dihydroxy-2-naphthoate octaprenyltransferase
MSSQGGPRVWAQAFVGFYRAQDTTARELDPIARFLFSARSVILVISAQAALVAGLLALTARRFDPLSFVLVLIGFLDAHAISNLSNDYFGYRRGHDTPDSPRLRYTVHPLASGMLTPRLLATGLALLGLVGLAIIAYFVALRGPLTLAFVAAGIALLFLYDASPVTLKSIGLGEIASFLVWGPLMVGGGYFVITGQLAAAPFFVSVPYGFGVASILVGKHIDQRPFDAAHGQRTLPVVLGDRATRALNRALVAGMYLVVVALAATRAVSPLVLIVAAALPRAIQAIELMGRPRPAEPPAGYVGWPLWYHRACLSHNRLFGWLYIAGLAAGAVVTLSIAP